MSDFIDEEIKREGGDKVTNDPNDAGGLTKYGLSKKSNPDVWADGDVSYQEARIAYQNKYIHIDGIDQITNLQLMHQVADCGIMSGPETAVKLLQQILGTKVDGVVGVNTINAITQYPDGLLFNTSVPGIVKLNSQYRDARIIYLITVAKRRPQDMQHILGWVKRVQEF